MQPRNALCSGTLQHVRQADVRHRFDYPVEMVLVALKSSTAKQFSPNRWAPLSLPPAGYLHIGDSIVAGVIKELAKADAPEPAEIYLLTQPGGLGMAFNPVSFYFCCTAANSPVTHILAHITNTPWDQTHVYQFAVDEATTQRFYFDKAFHVSPFLPMAMHYRWQFTLDTDHIRIIMQAHSNQKGRAAIKHGTAADEPSAAADFSADLQLSLQPLTAAALRRRMPRFVLQNLRTLARIYWQALRLWRKQAPFHNHPSNQSP